MQANLQRTQEKLSEAHHKASELHKKLGLLKLY